MARCSICSEMFVANEYETVCPECVDMEAGANVRDDYSDGPEPGDVDEIQENEDFAGDNDYGDAPEDRYLDNMWEDQHELGNYEGDYFGGDY